jgi:hypothetical protein
VLRERRFFGGRTEGRISGRQIATHPTSFSAGLVLRPPEFRATCFVFGIRFDEISPSKRKHI